MGDTLKRFELKKSIEQKLKTDLIASFYELFFSCSIIVGTFVFTEKYFLTKIFFGIIVNIIFLIVVRFTDIDFKKLYLKSFSLLMAYFLLILLFPEHSWQIFFSFLIVIIFNIEIGISHSFGKDNTKIKRTEIIRVIYLLISFFIIFLPFLTGLDKIPVLYFKLPESNRLQVIIVALILLLFAELITRTFSDGIKSFILPFSSAVLIYLLMGESNLGILKDFLFALIIALIVSLASYYFKFLTYEGAVSQFILGAYIFGFGSWKWTIPIIVFFLLSSILSLIKSENKKASEKLYEKSGIRDSSQVIATGGIGGILVLVNQIYPSELFYLAYVTSIATACSDTWGTEIGTLFKAKTLSIKNFKITEQGTSGGISIPGTIGAILGAFIIPASAVSWLSTNYFILLIFIFAFIGNIIDSILGANLQAQYLCPVCNRITEKKIHCGEVSYLKQGINWLNNNEINFASALLSVILIITITVFYKV